jgi:hypothetical protein
LRYLLTSEEVLAAFLPAGMDKAEYGREVIEWYAGMARAQALTGANLSGANLRVMRRPGDNQIGLLSISPLTAPAPAGLDLSDADMCLAVLNRAALPFADLRQAALRMAFLREADLRGANLRGADLRSAHLDKANLRGAKFSSDTLLAGATLAGAGLVDVDWGGVNFSELDWNQYLSGDIFEEHWYQSVRKEGGPPRQSETGPGFMSMLHEATDDDAAFGWSLAGLRPWLPHLPNVRSDAAELVTRAYAQLAAEFARRGMTALADRASYLAKQHATAAIRPWRRSLGHRALGYLCGWGYRPSRTVAWWAIVNLVFTGLYLLWCPPTFITRSRRSRFRSPRSMVAGWRSSRQHMAPPSSC